jgi:anti-anti-sigma factor
VDIGRTAGAGGVVRLSVAGELDMATADEFAAAVLETLVSGDTVAVMLDFAAVSFCDSSGIRALDRLYGVAAEMGIHLRAENLQPIVRRVLEITGILEALTEP